MGDSGPAAAELELDADASADPPWLPVPSGPGSLGAEPEGRGELAFVEGGWLAVADGSEEVPFEHPDAASNATIGRIAHLRGR